MSDCRLGHQFFAIAGVWAVLMFVVDCQECRLSSTKRTMIPQEFESYACGECLYYIYFMAPSSYAINYRFKPCLEGLLICPQGKEETDWCACSNPAAVYNVQEHALSNSSSTSLHQLAVHPPLPSDFVHFTSECCAEAARCCREVLQNDVQSNTELRDTDRCPATWDGWQCFDRAQPGIVPANCPNYIYGEKLRYHQENVNYAVKKCEQSGKWFAVNASEKLEIEWTDYSLCLARESTLIKFIVGVASFAVSVVAIVPALIIMSSYRLLKTQDVFVLHRHLLTSFLLCGIFYIFNSFFFVIDGGPGEGLYMNNHVSCRVLFTIQLRYLRLTTYTWMLSEGWYLHRLLIAAFAEPKSLRAYYLVCWGFPVVPTALYSVFRTLYDDGDCWVAPSQEAWIDWIITGPCLAALCVNLVLMIAILYILIRKLRFSPDLEPVQYRKAVRATLILLPVFGLHFLLTIYRVPILAHEIFNLLLDGLQGFFVAVIICYTNGRVTECLHKTWQARKDQDELRKQSLANRIKYRKSMDLGRTAETEIMLMTMEDRRSSNTSNTSQRLQVPSQ